MKKTILCRIIIKDVNGALCLLIIIASGSGSLCVDWSSVLVFVIPETKIECVLFPDMVSQWWSIEWWRLLLAYLLWWKEMLLLNPLALFVFHWCNSASWEVPEECRLDFNSERLWEREERCASSGVTVAFLILCSFSMQVTDLRL